MFSQLLAMVFGSILVVQIIAHLPLTDIKMPANVLQQFQVMISVVSFDYFPPFEYVDVGFSEAWAYSPNFEWIGYDTINFMVGLGSIIVFAAIELLIILIAVMIRPCLSRCRCRYLREKFSSSVVWQGALTFIHGTFF